MSKIEMSPPCSIRPRRTFASSESLSIIGIPKKFQSKSLKDFNTYSSSDLSEVKNFVKDFISFIPDTFEECMGIFFYGSNGVGKTMLSSIILKEAYLCRYSVKRSTFVKYVSSYTANWGSESSEDFSLWQECKSSEFLCLEEVGKEIDSKITKPILEDLLRYREEKGLITLMCTNLTPKDLSELYGPSIMSLIKGNMTPIKITGKDRRH